MNDSIVEGTVTVLLQLFFGMALGYAGIDMMLGAKGFPLVGILACFAALVLCTKALTRSALWLASLQRKGLR